MIFLPFSDTLIHPWVFLAALPARRTLQLYQSLTRSASQQLALISGPQRRSSHSCFVLRAESVAMRLPTMIHSKPTSGQNSHPCDSIDDLQSLCRNLTSSATSARPIRLKRHRRASQRARHRSSPLIDQVCVTYSSLKRVEVDLPADLIVTIRPRSFRETSRPFGLAIVDMRLTRQIWSAGASFIASIASTRPLALGADMYRLDSGGLDRSRTGRLEPFGSYRALAS